jgi:uncharacterized protein (TIGR02300 family)
VGKIDLGVKLSCESCGARYYDLNKTPAACPKCGTTNSRPVVFKSRRGGAPEPEEKRAPAAAAPAAVEEEDAIATTGDEEEEDEAVIEDTSDLGEDDDVEVVVDKDAEG